MYEPKAIIEEIVNRAQIQQFTKTMRGLKFHGVEFIFSTDKLVDDPCVIARPISKKEDVDAGHFVRSDKIRNRLIAIFEAV
jgi:hypothetical protein